MNKFFITVLVATVVVAAVNAARIPNQSAADTKEPVAIIKSINEVTPDGGYTFMFEAEDGSYREETAVPMNVGTEDAYLAITGTYRYIDADGQPIEVHYTADQKGFLPSGTNIPESISRAAVLAAEAAGAEENSNQRTKGRKH